MLLSLFFGSVHPASIEWVQSGANDVSVQCEQQQKCDNRHEANSLAPTCGILTKKLKQDGKYLYENNHLHLVGI